MALKNWKTIDLQEKTAVLRIAHKRRKVLQSGN